MKLRYSETDKFISFERTSEESILIQSVPNFTLIYADISNIECEATKVAVIIRAINKASNDDDYMYLATKKLLSKYLQIDDRKISKLIKQVENIEVEPAYNPETGLFEGSGYYLANIEK